MDSIICEFFKQVEGPSAFAFISDIVLKRHARPRCGYYDYDSKANGTVSIVFLSLVYTFFLEGKKLCNILLSIGYL